MTKTLMNSQLNEQSGTATQQKEVVHLGHVFGEDFLLGLCYRSPPPTPCSSWLTGREQPCSPQAHSLMRPNHQPAQNNEARGPRLKLTNHEPKSSVFQVAYSGIFVTGMGRLTRFSSHVPPSSASSENCGPNQQDRTGQITKIKRRGKAGPTHWPTQ